MKGLLALITIFAFGPLASAQSTFHGDNARTGVYAGAGPVKLTGVKWAFKSEGPIVTSPTLAGGVVYIASLSGHLFAVDEETGKEKGNFKSRMPIASSPAAVTVLASVSCKPFVRAATACGPGHRAGAELARHARRGPRHRAPDRGRLVRGRAF